ncbi:hypothetical protein DRP05_04495 [Archaeoglobales archaeon]|nr:MAG: hypothetical protein DRP05_04495 [Archaeoglobales archaeon]
MSAKDIAYALVGGRTGIRGLTIVLPCLLVFFFTLILSFNLRSLTLMSVAAFSLAIPVSIRHGEVSKGMGYAVYIFVIFSSFIVVPFQHFIDRPLGLMVAIGLGVVLNPVIDRMKTYIEKAYYTDLYSVILGVDDKIAEILTISQEDGFDFLIHKLKRDYKFREEVTKQLLIWIHNKERKLQNIRYFAILLLGEIGDKNIIPELEKLLDEDTVIEIEVGEIKGIGPVSKEYKISQLAREAIEKIKEREGVS